MSVTIDGTDTPIQDVDVTLTDTTDSDVTFTGKTGSAGGCTLSNVTVGSYTVTAEAEGYTDYEDTLTVTAETDTLEIEMTVKTQEEENTPGGG